MGAKFAQLIRELLNNLIILSIDECSIYSDTSTLWADKRITASVKFFK